MTLMNTARRRILNAFFHPISLRAFFLNCITLGLIIYGFETFSFTVAFLVLISAYATYYYCYVLKPTEIIYSPGSHTAQRLLTNIPCLKNGGYKTSFWTMNRHVNTVWGVIRPSLTDNRTLGFHREVAHGVFADGENCVLDWYKAPAHLAEKAAEEWNHDLVQTFASSGCSNSNNNSNSNSSCCGAAAETFLEHLDHLNVMKQRHPDTAAASGRLPRKNPVIVVFHGLTTGYGDNNITRVVHAITRMGWDAVIPVRRGCGDDPSLVTKPKYYAYGGLEDTAITIEYIAKRVPDHPLFAVGFSAGSNVMVNYLGTQGKCSLLHGAVSFANGYCWQRGTETIEKKSPIWNVAMAMLWKSSVIHPHKKIMTVTHTYGVSTGMSAKTSRENSAENNNADSNSSSNNNSLSSSNSNSNNSDVLRPITEQNRKNLADVDGNFECGSAKYQQDESELKEWSNLNQSNNKTKPLQHTLRGLASIREIDELISKEIHGFDSLDEFYAEQSCAHRLHRVKVPVIFCNAMDDPIASGDNVPREAMKMNENFLCALTPRGGHLGWAQGSFPIGNFPRTRSFMDDLTIQGLSALMVEAKFRMRNFTSVTNNEGTSSARLMMMKHHLNNNNNSSASSPSMAIPRNVTTSSINHNNNNGGARTFSTSLGSDSNSTKGKLFSNYQSKNDFFAIPDSPEKQQDQNQQKGNGMFLSATSFETNNSVERVNNNHNHNNSTASTPVRYVATPTMTIPREIALFPKIAKKQ